MQHLAQDENRQLKGTVNSLREELEKTRIGVEGACATCGIRIGGRSEAVEGDGELVA